MWLFGIKKKGKRSRKVYEEANLKQLIDREHIREAHKNDVELRFWIPELCKQALDSTVEICMTTTSRYLREFFVVYLYGEHELLCMRKNKTGLYFEPKMRLEEDVDSPEILFSKVVPPDVLPDLGKNIVPIKLLLPEAIKNDLNDLATKVDQKLSSFVRGILIADLLGHTFWREDLKTWPLDAERIANKWENNSKNELNQ